MSGLFAFLRRQRRTLPSPPVVSLASKNVIVTGANTGLGFEAALGLAKMKPARLILACRNVERGNTAIAQIKADAGVSKDTLIEVWELDLANFKSVTAFAARIEKELDRLDIVIENAGICTWKWNTTVDGWESTLQVNVLSTFLLALLLAPLLQRTAQLSQPPPRLVILASDRHYSSKFKEKSSTSIFLSLNDQSKFSSIDRYATSKLLDVLLTRELSKRVNNGIAGQDDVSICSLNPGLCYSDLLREITGNPILRSFVRFLRLFARTRQQGGGIIIHAAVSPEMGHLHGEYLSECEIAEPLKLVRSPEGEALQGKLWGELVDIYGKLGVRRDVLI